MYSNKQEGDSLKKYTVGIDFGTLSGRCLLADVENGQEAAVSVLEFPHQVMSEQLPDGTPLMIDWHLQHPQDYLDVLAHTVRAVLKEAGVLPEQVIGVGVDFTSCTMLPILKDGTPLCFLEEFRSQPNAYVKLWKHHSAQPWADRMNKVAHERGETFIHRYGEKISSEWMFPKILQTLEESPQVYKRADAFLEATDWIVMKLTGKLIRNSCSAGAKACWHKRDGFPSKEYFKALNPEFEHVIEEKFWGEVRSIGTRAGELTKEAAALTGLLEGTPVAVGHLDAHGATIGAKVTGPGKMLIMMGTSSCHEIMCETEHLVPGICGYVEDGIVPGYFGYEAGQACVGDHFSWFMENCLPSSYEEKAKKAGKTVYAYLDELAAAKEVGENGLIALDWWNGNRTVLVDGTLSGMLVGCTLLTRPEDIYRALMEGTAFGTRKIVETFEEYGVPVEEIIIAGGIAQKNPFMMQMYSDVTGRPIRIAGSKQNAALSSCIWAAVAAGKENGGYDEVSEAADKMGSLLDKEYLPDMKNKKAYDALYAEYETLHDYFGRGENQVMKRMKERMEKCRQKKSADERKGDKLTC